MALLYQREVLGLDHLLLERKPPHQIRLRLRNSPSSGAAKPGSKDRGIPFEKFPKTPSSPCKCESKSELSRRELVTQSGLPRKEALTEKK
jgi:hypothetical protein